jgi:kynurenine formamidase
MVRLLGGGLTAIGFLRSPLLLVDIAGGKDVSARWNTRPEGSNWGEFGCDDQRGRLNLIDRAKVLEGVAEVREGITFCLSLPLDLPGGNYHNLGRRPPMLRPLLSSGKPKFNLRPHSQRTDVFCDDCAEIHTHFSTHWDALAHAGAVFDADQDGIAEVRYYNGYRGGADIGVGGARALGIENMARTGVQGRAVMIDLHGTFGVARRLVGYDDLMRAAELSGAVVERGDIVCLHTGQATALLEAGRDPPAALLEDSFCHLDGCDERLLSWIDASGLALLAADNFAVEAVPPRAVEDGRAYERIHELCLFKLGIHLGELWYLGELNAWLRAHTRSRFLLTAPPLCLPGAVGSPVTPVATV